jgi:Ca2+:H+ antiporter
MVSRAATDGPHGTGAYDARVTVAHRSTFPVLGALSPFARSAVVATILISVAAVVLDLGLHADPTVVFVIAAAAILGLAWVVGLSTERLGALTGPQVGGVLNATFGNIAELIIAFFALQAGLIEVVKASITGSIIGNLLLVLGVSVLVGGLRHGPQTFSARVAGSNAALLVLALVGLFVPAVFASTTSDPTQGTLTEESLLVAIVLLVGYVLSLVYQFTNPSHTLGGHEEPAGHGGPAWSGRVAVGVLLVAAALLALLSEILVSSIEPFIETFGLSAFFVGVVLIPTIGNLAEHLVAVQLAAKDNMGFAMAVCYGSSLQVALFVAPVLVIVGVVIGRPMDLVFTPLEVAAVAAAVGISALIALDGESNWLEGALLALVYLVLAVSFFEFVGPLGG